MTDMLSTNQFTELFDQQYLKKELSQRFGFWRENRHSRK